MYNDIVSFLLLFGIVVDLKLQSSAKWQNNEEHQNKKWSKLTFFLMTKDWKQWHDKTEWKFFWHIASLHANENPNNDHAEHQNGKRF